MLAMSEYLFDTPYWLLALLAVVGVGLLVSANARQEKRLARAGAGVLIAGILLALVSYFVQTDKEKVLGRSKELVAAVEKKDKAALDKLLHPGVTLSGPQLTKDRIIEVAVEKVEQYRITNVKLSAEEPVRRSSGVIEVSGTVTANPEALGMGGNTPTDWRFVWVRTPEGWRVREIIPLKFAFGNVDLQGLISQRVR